MFFASFILSWRLKEVVIVSSSKGDFSVDQTESRFSSAFWANRYSPRFSHGFWDDYFLSDESGNSSPPCDYGSNQKYDLRVTLKPMSSDSRFDDYSLCKVKSIGEALEVMRTQIIGNRVYFDTWHKFKKLGDGDWVLVKYSLHLCS